jgi:hypothetical protein
MADTRCYRNSTHNGEWSIDDVSSQQIVCPGTQQPDGFSRCCGRSAICLPGNICQALDSKIAEGATGFYVGSCTDRNYESSACPNFCTFYSRNEIVYNATADAWQCCGADGNGNPKCDRPWKPSSKAPAPSVLLQSYSASVYTFTASTSTSSGTGSASTALPASTTSGAPDATATSENQGGGLSTGAKAGAGVAGAIGGLLIIALVVWLFMRRRKQSSKSGPSNHQEYYDMPKYDPAAPASSGNTSDKHELSGKTHPVELSSSNAVPGRVELSASAQAPRSVAQIPQELPS